MQSSSRAVAGGILCGVLAALCWATGFVATRRGLDIGFSPVDLTLHRYVWFGFAMVPAVWSRGIGNLYGVGWTRGIVLAMVGGPGFAILSYAGVSLMPLGHAGIIQPSCAMLGGLIFATAVLREKLPTMRMVGALVIVSGLVVVGAEAVMRGGFHGASGDLIFVFAGLMFGLFGTLLRRWQVGSVAAIVVVSVMSLFALPIYAFTPGFAHALSLGFGANLAQAVMQGVLMGVGATYLFVRSIAILGAGRAAAFPALVPPFTLLVAWLLLGTRPSALQLVGLCVILAGFSIAQRARA